MTKRRTSSQDDSIVDRCRSLKFETLEDRRVLSAVGFATATGVGFDITGDDQTVVIGHEQGFVTLNGSIDLDQQTAGDQSVRVADVNSLVINGEQGSVGEAVFFKSDFAGAFSLDDVTIKHISELHIKRQLEVNRDFTFFSQSDNGVVSDYGIGRLVVGNQTKIEADNLNISLESRSNRLGTSVFVSGRDVTLFDGGDLRISDIAASGQLNLSAAGSVLDNGAAQIVSAGNARLVAGGSIDLLGDAHSRLYVADHLSLEFGDMAVVRTLGTSEFGSVSLESSNGVATIFEDGDLVFAGHTALKNLTVRSSGVIADAPSTTIRVAQNATFESRRISLSNSAGDMMSVGQKTTLLGSSSISIGMTGNAELRNVNFVSAGRVMVHESDGFFLSGDNHADKLVVKSSGSLRDRVDSKLTVNLWANMDAEDGIVIADHNDNKITIGGRASFTADQVVRVGFHGNANFGQVSFNARGIVSFSSIDSITVYGSNTAGTLRLVSGESIRDHAGSQIEATDAAFFDAGVMVEMADHVDDRLVVCATASIFAGEEIQIHDEGFVEFLNYVTSEGIPVSIALDSDCVDTLV